MGKLIFILGGARSGKSSFALELAQKLGKRVTYIATAFPVDSEMRERIKKHKNARPKNWKTIVVKNNLDKKIAEEENEVILIDCLTIYIYHLMNPHTKGAHLKNWAKPSASYGVGVNLPETKILDHIKRTIKVIKKSRSDIIIVSNEVGCSIHPKNKLGRDYRDILGKVNQIFARACDEFYVMFAGIPINIKKLYEPRV